MFLDEFFMAFHRVRRDAEEGDAESCEIGSKRREGNRFGRAGGGVILGIEINYQRLSGKIGKANAIAAVAWKIEIRCLVAYAELNWKNFRHGKTFLLPVF